MAKKKPPVTDFSDYPCEILVVGHPILDLEPLTMKSLHDIDYPIKTELELPIGKVRHIMFWRLIDKNGEVERFFAITEQVN